MSFKSVKSALAVATLALAGAASAATVSPIATYNVSGSGSFDIVTIASNRDEAGNPTSTPYQANYFYEFVVGAFDSLSTFLLSGTTNETVPVRYFLFEDTDNTVGASNTGVELAETVPYLNVGGSFQYALQSGKQYVLQIQKNSSGWESITTNVSAVPLPGAIWMFGTALLGFLGFSSRRKV